MSLPDHDDDDSAETVACPSCRRPVYEEAEQCPYCGHYISEEEMASSRPWWVIIGALVCLGLALGWAVGC